MFNKVEYNVHFVGLLFVPIVDVLRALDFRLLCWLCIVGVLPRLPYDPSTIYMFRSVALLAQAT